MPRMLTLGIAASSAAHEHAVGQRGVVVAGQDHHRSASLGKQLRGAGENRRGHAVVVKGIAGEQHEIGVGRARGGQHRGKAGDTVAVLGGRKSCRRRAGRRSGPGRCPPGTAEMWAWAGMVGSSVSRDNREAGAIRLLVRCNQTLHSAVNCQLKSRQSRSPCKVAARTEHGSPGACWIACCRRCVGSAHSHRCDQRQQRRAFNARV